MSNLKIQSITSNIPVLDFGRSQNFTGVQKSNVISKDSVSLSNQQIDKKKKRMLNGTATALCAGLLLFYNSIFKPSRIPEYVEFTKASSVKDAITFGKKFLGISKYKNFAEKDLDIINWINEGLVNIRNKFKGKIDVPKKIEMINNNDKNLKACVRHDFVSYESWLGINRQFYENLDEILKKDIATYSDEKLDLFDPKSTLVFKKLLEQYKQGRLTSFNGKVRLCDELNKISHEYRNSTLKNLEEIISDQDLKQKLIDRGVLCGETNRVKLWDGFNITLDEKLLETSSSIQDFLKAILIHLSKYKIKHNPQSPFRTIYHEIGHFNDKIRYYDVVFNDNMKAEDLLKIWDNNAKDFETAYLVSNYASTSPTEFVAETFAELVSGSKLDDRVIELYVKLGGKFPA